MTSGGVPPPSGSLISDPAQPLPVTERKSSVKSATPPVVNVADREILLPVGA